MFFEVKHSFGRTKSGRRRRKDALYLVEYVKGKRVRRYFKYGQFRNSGGFISLRRTASPGAFFSPGRPRSVPPEVRQMLDDCGFSTYGTRVCMNLKKFFSIDAARFRFALLAEEQKELVMFSPEILLRLETEAYARLKSCNARGLSFDYADNFERVLEWFYRSCDTIGALEDEEARRESTCGASRN